MDRYFIAESHPSGKYYIWDRKTSRTIGEPIVSEKRAIEICIWLNKSKLILSNEKPT